MCRSCVGSELLPAPGSIHKSDNDRKLSADSTLWNAEGKQYKNLKADWYDMIVLLITLALSIGNSRCCFVWILFTTEFLLQCFFLPCCLWYILWTLDFSPLFLNETSLFKSQCDSVKSKSQLSKKRDYLLFQQIHKNLGCVCLFQPALRNGSTQNKYEKLTVQFPKLVYFYFSLKHMLF